MTAAVIVLRFKLPHAPRPYRTWGYPLVPIGVLGDRHLRWHTNPKRKQGKCLRSSPALRVRVEAGRSQ